MGDAWPLLAHTHRRARTPQGCCFGSDDEDAGPSAAAMPPEPARPWRAGCWPCMVGRARRLSDRPGTTTCTSALRVCVSAGQRRAASVAMRLQKRKVKLRLRE